ncbi:DoxX family protein [Flavobacterium aquidurense]|uniref:DoxX family protein n=1 Tax=Flavobacterium aquidurense TaxID=362413 RepID=UPI003721B76C
MENKKKNTKALKIATLIVQLILSASLLWAGITKLFQPVATLAKMWPWVAQNLILVKLTGVIDLIGALGLLLPLFILKRKPYAKYAAIGIFILMICASIFHIRRGEASLIGINIIFSLMALFIAWRTPR